MVDTGAQMRDDELAYVFIAAISLPLLQNIRKCSLQVCADNAAAPNSIEKIIVPIYLFGLLHEI